MFEQEYKRANDRIHPRKDLLQEMEKKWAAEEAKEAEQERKIAAFPLWIKALSLAAGILLCVGLGLESMILFGRSRGIEKKTASAEAPMAAEAMVPAEEEEAQILLEPAAGLAEDVAETEDAAVPETMLMAAYAPPQGTHLAVDEAEVEDAVRYGALDRGEGAQSPQANAQADATAQPTATSLPKQAKAAPEAVGVQYPQGEILRRGELLTVFMPTSQQVHVVRYANRKLTNVFSLGIQERGAQVQRLFWMGSELLAVREKNGGTELLRFDVSDWKAPRHLANLTQSGTLLGMGELNGRLYILSLYRATEEEPLPWVNGERIDFDRVLLDGERPGDTFTVLTVYEPGGDGFAAQNALLARAQGAAAAGDRLLLWSEGADLYAFTLEETGLVLTAESARPGTVLAAHVTGTGYALLVENGGDAAFLALDGDLSETASATAAAVGSVRDAQAYEDGALLLTADGLHWLTAAGDHALALSGDGFRRLTEDRALVFSAAGQLQLIALGKNGLEALGAAKIRGGDLALLLEDPSRMDYDPATGRLAIPAGQIVCQYLIDEAGAITPRGENQVFYDHNETEQRELRVLLMEDQALIFHKNGIALCNHYLVRQSNSRY